MIELCIINQKVQEILKNKNIKIHYPFVGNYMTSLDMGGFSITICKLNNEMKELLEFKES